MADNRNFNYYIDFVVNKTNRSNFGVYYRRIHKYFSVITTLIAAWVKKCNYVDRIKNIDRYIQSVSNLNIKIEYILSKPAWERIPYDKFSEAYEDKITSLVAENPPMSPQEFKTTVWQLTKFYPELVKDTYPWYYKDKEGKHVMTEWGSTILDTYEAVYYSAWWRRICSCYYCMCKCWDCKNCSCKETDNYIRSVYETENNNNEIRSLPADPETSLMLSELKCFKICWAPSIFRALQIKKWGQSHQGPITFI